MGNVVIVALPEKDDPVWKQSSEKVPHLTILSLGDREGGPEMAHILEYMEHAANTMLHKFHLSVEDRGPLGPKDADVLFFEKIRHGSEIHEFRDALLKDGQLREWFNSSDQFPEWRPHLTMGWPDKPAKESEWGKCYGVNFDRLALWTGDYDGPEFKLQSYRHYYEDGQPTLAMSMSAIDHELSVIASYREVMVADLQHAGQTIGDVVKALSKEQTDLFDRVVGAVTEGIEVPLSQEYIDIYEDMTEVQRQVLNFLVGSVLEPGYKVPGELAQSAMDSSVEVGVDDALQYGKKGMKWGIRKSDSGGSSSGGASKKVAKGDLAPTISSIRKNQAALGNHAARQQQAGSKATRKLLAQSGGLSNRQLKQSMNVMNSLSLDQRVADMDVVQSSLIGERLGFTGNGQNGSTSTIEAGADDALQAGVKGMKWGVRKDNPGGSVKAVHKTHVDGKLRDTVAKMAGLKTDPRFAGKDLLKDPDLKQIYDNEVTKAIKGIGKQVGTTVAIGGTALVLAPFVPPSVTSATLGTARAVVGLRSKPAPPDNRNEDKLEQSALSHAEDDGVVETFYRLDITRDAKGFITDMVAVEVEEEIDDEVINTVSDYLAQHDMELFELSSDITVSAEDALQYGKKGMKWGVRRVRTASGRVGTKIASTSGRAAKATGTAGKNAAVSGAKATGRAGKRVAVSTAKASGRGARNTLVGKPLPKDSFEAIQLKREVKKAKGTYTLTNADLEKLNKRIQLENNYRELSTKQSSLIKNHSKVKTALDLGKTANEAIKFANSDAGKLLSGAITGKSSGKRAKR